MRLLRLDVAFCGAILALALFSGCDFNDAMTATKSMPSKIDETNDQVSDTNRKIDKTNQNMLDMKSELAAMDAVMEAMNGAMEQMQHALDNLDAALQAMQSSIDAMKDSTAEMNAKMDATNAAIAETNKKMEKTNSAIHKQVLVAALTELLSPENTKYLFPPTSMLASGQAFAEEATSDEIVQLVYVYLEDIDQVQPDDSLQGPDGKFPPALIAQVDHDKLAKFTALEVIAGLMPQESVADAVQTQITGGGQYDTTVYSLLMLRTLLIKSFLVEEDLFSHEMDDLGKIAEGVSRVEDLDWIARLPFANRIAVKTLGMLDPNDNVNEKLNPRMTVALWNHLAMAINTELDPAKVGNSPGAQAKLQELKATIQRYQDSWKK